MALVAQVDERVCFHVIVNVTGIEAILIVVDEWAGWWSKEPRRLGEVEQRREEVAGGHGIEVQAESRVEHV